ncbi:unnamed protein product [Tuber melanosporum]|uniref:(Perigord truffle) hypothetical protein n=1 Tax=Tuber melanosporum (strain Mel28) TaxID=656061 RepID=D5GID3_TUBMM|nr:uncharacterized protein GSTUM_00008434001 [Tuber melanosporum]CAZ84276.1 unnamed protein product [Tuber melanosporum]
MAVGYHDPHRYKEEPASKVGEREQDKTDVNKSGPGKEWGGGVKGGGTKCMMNWMDGQMETPPPHLTHFTHPMNPR